MTDLRQQVANELTVLTQSGVATTNSSRATAVQYGTSLQRRDFRRAVIDSYLSQGKPQRDSRVAVVTAGVPGAGKSRAVSEWIDDLDSYRRLDADVIKDDLLKQAVADGIYDDLLSRTLADGRPIAPRELSTLVHAESVAIVDELRKQSLARHENLIIEGTLTWNKHGSVILANLVAADYTDLTILAVEVPREQAQRQASDRWWSVRDAGQDPLGGRFTPPSIIADAYPDNLPESVCLGNARRLYSESQAADMTRVRLDIVKSGQHEIVSHDSGSANNQK